MIESCFVFLIIFVGTYLTFYTKFFCIRNLGRAVKSVFNPSNREQQGISVFASLCTTLAATIGTGNIVGVASAVTVGGPGTLFWMVIASAVSMTTKFAENVLAVKFRKKDNDGNYLGGPFSYILYGLGEKYRWLSKVFCVACLLAGVLGMGTIIQSGSIASSIESVFIKTKTESDFPIIKLLTAFVASALTAIVIFGGVRRIASVSEKIVPFMGVGYTVLCLFILIQYYYKIPDTLQLILRSAFSPKAALGTLAGMSVREIAFLGIGRGIFSNEAGLGTSSIAAASADSDNLLNHGYAGVASVFIDTVVLCTLTGLTVIMTGATGSSGVEIACNCWAVGLPWPPMISNCILCIFLTVFGFTSILGWNMYVERCSTFLFNRNWVRNIYQVLYVAAVFLGPFLSVSFAWKMADIMNAFMAIPNLISLFCLRKEIISCTRQNRRNSFPFLE